MSTVESRDLRGLGDVTTQTTRQSSGRSAAGASMIESLGGLAVIVLTIVGLTGWHMVGLSSVAAIVLGCALVFAAASAFARLARMFEDSTAAAEPNVDLGGGGLSQALGGIAGVVLGILAILGIASFVLVPVAAIVFGGTLMLGCGATARLNRFTVDSFYGTGHEFARRMAGEFVAAPSGLLVLVGLASIILGIIALTGVYPLTLSLVAMLCIGAGILLGGAAVSSKVLTVLRR